MTAVADPVTQPDVTTEPADTTQPPTDDQTLPPADDQTPPPTAEPDPSTTTEPAPPADDGTPVTGDTAPATDAPAAPVDDDGVRPNIEDGAPNGGDGNSDGILDSLQANVASLPSVYDVDGNGALDDYITIESPEGTTLAKVKALSVPSDPAPPTGVTFPAGLVDYDVHVANPGAKAEVTLYLPGGELGTVYMLQNGTWSDFSHRAEIDDVADEVTVALVDGGAGDADKTEDGVIEDPVGVSDPGDFGALGDIGALAVGDPGTITVRKETLPNGSAQSFTFNLYRCIGTNAESNSAPTNGNCDTLTTEKVLEGTFNLTDGNLNNFAVSDAVDRWYRVEETVPSGWNVTPTISCAQPGDGTTTPANGVLHFRFGDSGEPDANRTGDCTFTNRQALTLTVNKQTVPDGASGTFPFRLELCTESGTGTGCTGTGTFVTPDPQNLSDNGVAVWGPLINDRNYRITETVPPNWILSGRSCVGGEQNAINGDNGHVIRLTTDTAGESEGDCTFTNTQLRINVTKQTVPDGASGTFPFRLELCTEASGSNCTGTGTFVTPDPQNISDNGTATWIGLLNDRNYRITETVPSNWILSGRSCTGGEESGTNGTNGHVIRVTADTAAEALGSCTFTNTQLRINVTKQTVPDGVSGTFPFRLELCTESGSTGCTGTGTFVTPDPQNISDNGTATWVGLLNDRNYRITETLPPGWVLTGRSCTGGEDNGTNGANGHVVRVTTDTVAESTANCTFTNTAPPQPGDPGTISVIKETDPDSDDDFTFRLQRCGDSDSNNSCDGSDPFISPDEQEISNGEFALWLLSDATGTGGRFEITESDIPGGWELADMECTGNESSNGLVEIDDGVRIFVNSETDAVTCTFTNEVPQPGTITARKTGLRDVADNSYNADGIGQPLDGAFFEYSTNGGTTWLDLCGPTVGGVCTSGDVPAGDVLVREKTAPIGWTTIGADGIAYGAGSGDVNPDVDYYDEVEVPSGGNVETDWFVNRRNNPNVAVECGINIALLLDTSGSIEANLNSFQQAVNDFIDELAGTPTGLSVYSFAESATSNHAGFYNLLDPTDVDAALDLILGPGHLGDPDSDGNGIYDNDNTGGGTNWDAGFQQVLGAGAEFVVVLTDGNPTARNGDTGSTGTVNLGDVEAGILSANSVKAAGQKIFAVGAGSGISATNLKLISDESSFFATGVGDLPATFAALAQQFCGGTVTVIKQELVDGNWVEAAHDWTFTANGVGLINEQQVANDGNDHAAIFEFADGQSGPVTIAEDLLSGWSNTQQGNENASCTEGGDPVDVTDVESATDPGVTFQLGSLDAVTCVFRNQQVPGNIVIKKIAKGGNDGTFGFDGPDGGSTADFSLTPTTPTGPPNEFSAQSAPIPVNPGSYVWSELGPPAGWDFTGPIVCDDGQSITPSQVSGQTATINVDAGETVTCTWTNAKRGNIAIKKIAKGGNDGTFGFDGPDGGSTADFSLNPTTPTGPPKEFSAQSALIPVNPGSYVWSELGPPAGWDFTGPIVCDNPDGQNPSQVSSQTATINVGAGETVTCTWTNTKRGALVIKKLAIGGDDGSFGFDGPDGGSTADFSLSPITPTGPPNQFSAQHTESNLVPGSYVWSELGPPAGWDFTGPIVCDDGQSITPSTVSGQTATIKVDAGETVTCTWTNTKRASIIIKKIGVGEGDGATFTFSGSPAPFAPDFLQLTTETNGSTETSDPYLVVPNPNLNDPAYVISENTPPAGWDFTNLDCVGFAEISEAGAQATIKVGPGQTVTCTWTNTKRANVTVKKVGIGAGDGADFDFSIPSGFDPDDDPDGALELTTPSGGGSDEETYSVVPNAGGDPYVVSELAPPAGWDFTGLECSGSGTGIEDDETASITVGPGETVTCTWTNTKRGNVVIAKTAVGGNDEFSWAGDAPVGAQSFTTVDGAGSVSISVEPGDYDVTENGPPAGWDFTGLECSDENDDAGDSTHIGQSATYDVQPGETVTCTWTNTKRGNVVIAKTAVGGNDEFSWTGDAPVGARSFTTVDGAGSVSISVEPGDYDVTENGPPAGWDFTGPVVCSDENDNTGDSTHDGQTATYDVQPGETVTCTWTNTKRAVIKVQKITVPAGQDDDFTFELTHPDQPTQTQTVSGTDPATAFANAVVPDTAYAVTETDSPDGPPIYDPNGGNCYLDVNGVLTEPAVNPASVTPGPGETWTCVFTNTLRATITVVKTTAPSDSTQGFDFTLSGGEVLVDSITGLTSQQANGEQFLPSTGVVPGTYTVDEADPSASWIEDPNPTCDRADVDGDDDASPVNLVVEAGENWVCTFHNVQKGSITIEKTTVGDFGAFIFDVRGPGEEGPTATETITTSVGTNPNQETFSPLVPGNYDLDERDPGEQWIEGTFSCNYEGSTEEPVVGQTPSIDLEAGQAWTCEITNFKKAHIVVEKVTVTPNENDDTTFDFTGALSGSIGNGGSIDAYVDPEDGPFVVTEGAEDDWGIVSVICETGASHSEEREVTYDPDYGDDVTCTFTNGQARITVAKETVTPNENDTTTFDFTGDIAATLGDGQSESELVAAGGEGNPSNYSTTEGPEDDWALVGIECDEGGTDEGSTANYTVVAGDDLTCTFTNGQAQITVAKVTVTPNEADDTTFDFTGDITAGLKDGQSESELVAAGTDPTDYSTTEGAEDDWAIVSIECDEGASGDGSTATYSVSAGDDLSCTFTNGQARITVAKETVTPNEADDTTFDFTGDITATLGDGQSESELVAAGSDPSSYSTTEGAEEDWALVSIVCGEGGSSEDSTATYSVTAGDDVTCTFTNGQARIEVEKETVTADLPDDTTFDFTGDIAATLGDGQSASELVAAGTDPTDYSTTEGAAPGWALQSIECDESAGQSDDREATYAVSAGDDVSCTFTNVELGAITIVKDTGDPAVGVTFSYSATGGLVPATFDLDTDPGTVDPGNAQQFGGVEPGTYGVTEDELADAFGEWALALPVTCESDIGQSGSSFTQIDAEAGVTNGGVSIEFAAGDEVTCTFANAFVQATATVRVTKRIQGAAAPDAAGPFPVTLASESVPFSQTQSIPKGTDTVTFIPTAGLGYSVTEDEDALQPNWVLVGIECSVTLGEGDRQDQTLNAADFAVLGGEIIDCTVTNDPVVVGGIQVLPLTGSPVEIAVKSALWALGLGGFLLLASRWRRRGHADVAA